MTRLLTAVAGATLLIGVWWIPVASQGAPRRVDDAALRAANPAEWLGYGRDDAETHYSPLDQITRGNVASLKPAWTADLGTPTGSLDL